MYGLLFAALEGGGGGMNSIIHSTGKLYTQHVDMFATSSRSCITRDLTINSLYIIPLSWIESTPDLLAIRGGEYTHVSTQVQTLMSLK